MSITSLISYEILGAKEEFASWVSNISPYETPFTSLTGKASVSNKVFEWQTDRLDVVQSNAWGESHESIPAPILLATEPQSNYTQILRKVVEVSDTANAFVNHGRQSELEYQIEKATKEIKRDLESTFLSSQNKFEGDATHPRLMSGFYKLTADVDEVEPTTGAVVHKRLTTELFTESDIFNITENLYYAGSRANIIMFHPSYAKIFNEMFGYGRRVEMYTNTDEEVPNTLTEIVDPLGQKYLLLPNRFMSKGIIYFFHPHDWFQRVLRPPRASSLDKTGSSESWMLEIEVGLQHRNRFASGILELSDYTGGIEYTLEMDPQGDVTTNITSLQLSYTSNQVPNSVTWSSGNDSVATVDQNGLVTIVGMGNASISVSATFPFGVIKSSSSNFNVFGVKLILADASTNYPDADSVGVTITTNVPGGLPTDISDIATGVLPADLASFNTVNTNLTILKPGLATAKVSVTFPAPYGVLTDEAQLEINGFAMSPNPIPVVLGTDFVIPASEFVTYPDTLNPSGKYTFTVANVGDDDYAEIVESGNATTGWVYTIKPKIGTSTAVVVHNATYTVKPVNAPTKSTTIGIKVTGTNTFVTKPHVGVVHVGDVVQIETETNGPSATTATTWTSSNTAKATVSAIGEMTAVEAGIVTITGIREFANGQKVASQIRFTIQ